MKYVNFKYTIHRLKFCVIATFLFLLLPSGCSKANDTGVSKAFHSLYNNKNSIDNEKASKLYQQGVQAYNSQDIKLSDPTPLN